MELVAQPSRSQTLWFTVRDNVAGTVDDLRAASPHRALMRRVRPQGDRGRDLPPPPTGSLAHYEGLLEREAHIADVPTDLLKALCWYASGWRQFEPSGRVLSTPTPDGMRYGCMQLSEEWHPDAFPSAKSDAQASVRYAAGLLNWLYEQLGDWHRATVAFFGHDRGAEIAARRVRKYAEIRPWDSRHADTPTPPATAPARPGASQHRRVPAGSALGS